MAIYETTVGAAGSAVAALCRHLAGTAGFGSSTSPTAAEVGLYGTIAYNKIGGYLSANGYTHPQTDADVIAYLQGLQVLEMVIPIELSYPTAGPGEPNARFEEFTKQRDWYYEVIKDGALDVLGGAVDKLQASITGDSIDAKVSLDQDSDYVRNRFKRDMHTNPASGGSRSGPLYDADLA